MIKPTMTERPIIKPPTTPTIIGKFTGVGVGLVSCIIPAVGVAVTSCVLDSVWLLVADMEGLRDERKGVGVGVE